MDIDIEKCERFNESHPRTFHAVHAMGELRSFWKNEIVTVEDENGDMQGAMSLLIREDTDPAYR